MVHDWQDQTPEDLISYLCKPKPHVRTQRQIWSMHVYYGGPTRPVRSFSQCNHIE